MLKFFNDSNLRNEKETALLGEMFDSICAFVNFNQALIETISTRAMLKFQAGITVYGLNEREIEEKVKFLQ